MAPGGIDAGRVSRTLVANEEVPAQVYAMACVAEVAIAIPGRMDILSMVLH
jgi:hypothetical protein